MVPPQVTLTVHCVYDGAYPTPDPFEELKKIPQESDGKHGDSLSGSE
jgi:hypothetical protein